MSRALRGWLPALLWTVLIFLLSSRSSLPVSVGLGFDKLAHLAEYAVLGFLLAYGQARAGIAVAWAVLMGASAGALDEFYQSFVPGRMADPADWIADVLGVGAGIFLFYQFRRWREGGVRPRRSPPA